jgi:hypothetical protein
MFFEISTSLSKTETEEIPAKFPVILAIPMGVL